jgi:hypothetical protein
MARRRTFACPHCGATVARGAPACPECGSDARTGWSEEAESFGGDLPTGYDEDEDFDYEESLRDEGLAEDGGPSLARLRRRRMIAMCLLLLAAVLWWTFGR